MSSTPRLGCCGLCHNSIFWLMLWVCHGEANAGLSDQHLALGLSFIAPELRFRLPRRSHPGGRVFAQTAPSRTSF